MRLLTQDASDADSFMHDVFMHDSGTEDGMRVSHDVEGQVVTLVGRLDVHTVAEVRAELQKAVDRGTGPLVADLAGVEVLDATGLGVLMGVHRRALRGDRTLVLRGVPERLGRLLRATRLDRVLTIDEPARALEV